VTQEPARDLVDLLGDPGPVPASRQQAVLARLAVVWDSLHGADQTHMTAHKLTRAEHLQWQPPVLRFSIERHPAGPGQSDTVPMQGWAVDLEAGTAVLTGTTYQQSVLAAHRWEARPVVAELAAKLRYGAADPRLRWTDERDTCFPVLANILPPSALGAVRQAMTRRFLDAWRSMMLALGWTPHPSAVMASGGYFLRPESDLEDERTNALIEEWVAEYNDKMAAQQTADQPRDFEALVATLGVRFPGVRPLPDPDHDEKFLIGPPGAAWANARDLPHWEKGLGYAEGLCVWDPDVGSAPHAWGVDPVTGEAVEITMGLANLAGTAEQAEYTGVRINVPVARKYLEHHGIKLGVNSVLQGLTSTAVITGDSISWPFPAGVIPGLSRPRWEATEAAMRDAIFDWAAGKGVTSISQISSHRPRR
jgi:hypothetical protein